MLSDKLNNKLSYKEYIIIGSGLSGLTASQELINQNKEHILLTSNFHNSSSRESTLQKKRFSKNYAVSPKLNIKDLKNEMFHWLDIYEFDTFNFNLVQSLSSTLGGLSRYWGGNLGHDFDEILRSNIIKIMDVNKASSIKDDKNIKMISNLSERLIFKKKYKNSLFEVFSPYLAIKLTKDEFSLCSKCKAYYCNCSGRFLQEYRSYKNLIKEFEVNNIDFKNDLFYIYGNDKNREENILKCKYLIFACGPIASPYLLSKITTIPKKLNLNHNGLFSFPFISFFKIKNKPLGLSNVNIAIYKSKKKKVENDPYAYINIFPLKPQLLIKYPFLKFISQKILNRLYYCIVYTDSSFVKSEINLETKKIIGKYKKSFYLFSYYLFIRIICFLLRNGICLPLFMPIFSKPGSDIHYGSTLYKVNIKKDIKRRIFFSDASQVKEISAINSTVKNLVFTRKKLVKWLKSKTSENI